MYQNNNSKPFAGPTTNTTGGNNTGYNTQGRTPVKTDTDFPKGINFYPPNEKAPTFVKGNIVINRDSLMEWLSQQKETVRLDLKESKEGKMYLAINTYESKPKA